MRRTVHGKGRRRKVLEPFTVDGSTWFYADATSITVVRVIDPRGAARAAAAGASHTEQFKIPTRLLRAALRLTAAGKTT